MAFRRKGGGKPTWPLSVSEGQEKHDGSGVLGTASSSGNNTAHSHRVGGGNTRPPIDAHEDANHIRHTSGISSSQNMASIQESSQPSIADPRRGSSEHLHHSNTRGLDSSPPVDYGPQVRVQVLRPDPRPSAQRADNNPPAVIDLKTGTAAPAGDRAPRDTSNPEQRIDEYQSDSVERRYVGSPSRGNYKERSPSRSENHRRRRRGYSRRQTPPRVDHYSPPPRGYSDNRRERSREFPKGGDRWRPGEEHSRHLGQRPRSPARTHPHESSYRRGRSPPNEDPHLKTPQCPSPNNFPRHRSPSPRNSGDTSSRRLHSPERNPGKPSGGDSQYENASQSHGRRGYKEGIATPSAHGGSLGRQFGTKDSIQGGHGPTNIPETASSIGGGGVGRAGDKPHTVAGLASSGSPSSVMVTGSVSAAETVGANPSLSTAIPSPTGVLLKPTTAASSSPNTNIPPSAKIEIASTASPPTMDGPKSPNEKNTTGSSRGPTELSSTPPRSIPQRPTPPPQAASPSMAQGVPKTSYSSAPPEFDAEYLADREMARKFLGVSGEEFDAEMARRKADYDANIARRIALGHPIHGSQVAHPGGQNPRAASSKTGESSRSAQKPQTDTACKDFISHFKATIHVDFDDAMALGPDGTISHTHQPTADVKGKGKQIAGINDSDNNFSQENLWPRADPLGGPGLFASFTPRFQPAFASFVGGAPVYCIPRGPFGSSPGYSTALPSGPNQPGGNPKYVDRGCSPDPLPACPSCGPILKVSLKGFQPDLYHVHLRDHDEFAHQLFSDVPKNYYLFHVLTLPPYRTRVIHSDRFITLRNFTKIVRLGFNIHLPISQITVYLYGRGNDGLPLEWKPISINSVEDWDGSMIVGRRWSCQISVVVEFSPNNASADEHAPIPEDTEDEDTEDEEDEAGPSK